MVEKAAWEMGAAMLPPALRSSVLVWIRSGRVIRAAVTCKGLGSVFRCDLPPGVGDHRCRLPAIEAQTAADAGSNVGVPDAPLLKGLGEAALRWDMSPQA